MTNDQIMEKIERLEGRFMAIEFILHRSVAQQGPTAIQTLLKNIEGVKIVGHSPSVEKACREEFDTYRRELTIALSKLLVGTIEELDDA